MLHTCRQGRRMRPERRREVHLVILLPGPGRLLSPWGGVVLVPGQGRSDRLLLVTPPRGQSSLPPTLSSAHHGLPTTLSHKMCNTRAKKTRVANLSEPVVVAVAVPVVAVVAAVVAVVAVAVAVAVVAVAVVSDACLDVRCVCPQRHGDATTVTETNWWQVTWESRPPARLTCKVQHVGGVVNHRTRRLRFIALHLNPLKKGCLILLTGAARHSILSTAHHLHHL